MDAYSNLLEAYRTSGRTFAREEIRRIARKVIHHLRRMPASGVLEEYEDHRNLWVEFKLYCEIGPIDEFEWGFRQDIESFIKDALSKTPPHHIELLSVFASDEENQEDSASGASISINKICEVVWSRLHEEIRLEWR